MPNFAQEYPFLLFLPLVTFATAGLLAAIVHLALTVETKMRANRQVTAPSAGNPARLRADATAEIEWSLERQFSRQMKTLRESKPAFDEKSESIAATTAFNISAEPEPMFAKSSL